MSGLRRSQHLQVPFQHIELATKNFETCIGKGGYGSVYKGELTIAGKLTTVAVKRLNEQFGQGLKEFLTEIQLLAGQNHPNLISLLGYCDKGKEKIIVYEYAEHGSLDRYLTCSSTGYTLTWLERLRICVDAARGLDHLHNHVGDHQTIIHRDIKSSNILLDQNWVAKISDLGLSRLSLAGLDRSEVISHACGTPGYCEPEYIITGIVKKESDVYSFGVVLFEVLCGRLCRVRHDDGLLLSAKLAKDYYEGHNLDDIIDPELREQMSLESMRKFSVIAYACLQDDRGCRPTMDIVVKELVGSLEIQVELDSDKGMKLPPYYEDIIKRLSPNAVQARKRKLFSLQPQGTLFDNKESFFWINDGGKKCVLISAARFMVAMKPKWEFQPDLRFSRVAEFSREQFHDIRCEIKPTMLSLGTIYAASLVFKFRGQSNKDLKTSRLITIKWNTVDFSVESIHVAEPTTDNWYKIKMWYFIHHMPEAKFDIVIDELSYFEDPDKSCIFIQGMEFQPIEMYSEGMDAKYAHREKQYPKYIQVSEIENTYWEKKLPKDYQYYIQVSDKPLSYTSKKELYNLLCAGFLGYNSKLWFSLCKSTGGICSMLSASEICPPYWVYPSESRFGEVTELQGGWYFGFTCKLRRRMFSPEHIYACYLVFKFKDTNSWYKETHSLDAHCMVDDQHHSSNCLYLVFLPPINIPTIMPKNDYGSHDSSNILRNEECWMSKDRIYRAVDSWMEPREDGWMEVILCKLLCHLEDHSFLKVILQMEVS